MQADQNGRLHREHAKGAARPGRSARRSSGKVQLYPAQQRAARVGADDREPQGRDLIAEHPWTFPVIV